MAVANKEPERLTSIMKKGQKQRLCDKGFLGRQFTVIQKALPKYTLQEIVDKTSSDKSVFDNKGRVHSDIPL